MQKSNLKNIELFRIKYSTIVGDVFTGFFIWCIMGKK